MKLLRLRKAALEWPEGKTLGLFITALKGLIDASMVTEPPRKEWITQHKGLLVKLRQSFPLTEPSFLHQFIHLPSFPAAGTGAVLSFQTVKGSEQGLSREVPAEWTVRFSAMHRTLRDSGSGVGPCRRGRQEKQTSTASPGQSAYLHTASTRTEGITRRAAVAGNRGKKRKGKRGQEH